MQQDLTQDQQKDRRLLRPVRQPMAWVATNLARFFKTKPLGAFGLVIIIFALIIAVAAPLIAPYDPYELRHAHRLEPPSAAFWFGTDALGRDILSRTLYGARISMYVGVVTMLLSAATCPDSPYHTR